MSFSDSELKHKESELAFTDPKFLSFTFHARLEVGSGKLIS